MSILQQFFLALSQSSTAILKGKTQTYKALFIYIACGLAVFGVVFSLLIQYEPQIKTAVMHYLLPQSWHNISERLIQFFFESQTKVVLASLIINSAIVLSSMVLFPIKEWASRTYERENQLSPGKQEEFPLWLQGLEECKLLFIYLTAQSVILAIGYYPYAWSSAISNILSILFLCFSFGLDLIAPTLQRNKIKYSAILKVLLKNPVLTLAFGAVFSLPLVYLGQLILAAEQLSLAQLSAVLFAINLLLLAVAIPAGTGIASRLLDTTRNTASPTRASKIKVYSVLSILLVMSGSFHYLVAMSMHHKSQLMKCEYTIDWDSLKTDWPSISALMNGEQDAKFEVYLEVRNPTPFDLEIENSQLQIFQNLKLVSSTSINAFYVPSGETVKHKLKLSTQFNKNALSNFSGLLEGWSVQITLDLLPGIPFIIQVVE